LEGTPHTSEPVRVPLGEGAAASAPTAPHATPRLAEAPSTGAERFWSGRWTAVALVTSFTLSIGFHLLPAMPIDWPHLFFDVRDVEGEAAIPVDMFTEPEPPPPPPPAPTVAEPEEPVPVPLPVPKPPRRDAGAPRDAGVRDAQPTDAEGVGPTDAGLSDAPAEAMAVAAFDPDAGPRDPRAIVGAAGEVQADKVLVMVLVNTEVIRKNPVGATLGFLLRGIPQWDSFMSGTSLDPVRQTDWLLISGPSLANTSRDVVLIHYSAPDAVVDRAVDAVSHRYAKGGIIDAGVPGMRASLALADRAERVLLRPQAHVLAVVPPSVLEKVARSLSHARVPAHVRPSEALYFRMVTPYRALPELPKSLEEMRLRVVPRSDEGVDVWIDVDTQSADAEQAATEIRRVLRRHNDVFTSMATGGLLDRVRVDSDSRGVHLHVTASREDLERLLDLVSSVLGLQPDSPSPAVPRPKGSR